MRASNEGRGTEPAESSAEHVHIAGLAGLASRKEEGRYTLTDGDDGRSEVRVRSTPRYRQPRT
eukprot:1588297-Pyramimonas_sp.AAC.1